MSRLSNETSHMLDQGVKRLFGSILDVMNDMVQHQWSTLFDEFNIVMHIGAMKFI